MEIHELPNGSPTSSDYLAIDNGTTRKTGFSSFDLGDNNVTFTSGDTTTPTIWQTVSAITSGSLKTILAGVSSMMANVRYLKNLIGSTSISGIGDGSITGALSNLNTKLGSFQSVTLSIGYVVDESLLAKVQRAYNDQNMPKGVPFFAIVASGAYYTMEGFWYDNSETGFCTVSLYNHSYFVSLINGVWNIYGVDRIEDVASGYLTAANAVALTTSLQVIPMDTDYITRGCFERTGDGGYRTKKAMSCKVSASGHVASATVDDVVIFNISRYSSAGGGSWTMTGQSFMCAGTTTDRSFSIPEYLVQIPENEIIYLRGRNASGARGSVDAARLSIEPIY